MATNCLQYWNYSPFEGGRGGVRNNASSQFKIKPSSLLTL